MKTTTSAYDTQNDLPVKNFVGTVEFNSITRKYASQTFGDISGNHKKFLRNMQITTPNLDFINNPSMGSEIATFDVLDKDLDVTTILKDNSLIGKDITLKLGFQEINEADFVSIGAHRIREVDLNGNLAYSFISEDVKRRFRKKLFRNKVQSTLNGAITNSDTTLTLSSAATFPDPANFSASNETFAHFAFVVKIESEFITFTGISTNDLTTLSRGAFGTNAVAHDSSTEVEFYWVFNLFEWHTLLLSLLLTTDDASGHGFYDLGRLDSNMSKIGMGFAASDIDIDGIELIGNKLQGWLLQRIGFNRPENALALIDKYILRPNALFMYVDGTGKITINSFDLIHFNGDFSSVKTLDDGDILNASFVQDDDMLINSLRLNCNLYFPFGSDDAALHTLTSSISSYGEIEDTVEISIPTPGIASLNDGIQKMFALRWLYFFGNIHGIVTLRCKFENWILEQGDYIQITWAKFPDLIAGTRGWTTKNAIILGHRFLFDFVNPQNSVIEYTALHHELYTRVSSFFSASDTVAEGSITRTALDFNTDITATLNSEDAFHDFSPQKTPDLVKVTVEITLPASGSTQHTVGFVFDSQEDTGGGTFVSRGLRTVQYVRYLSSDSGTLTVDFWWSAHGVNNNCDRVKVNWFDASHGSTERPTAMKITEVVLIDFDQAIVVS